MKERVEISGVLAALAVAIVLAYLVVGYALKGEVQFTVEVVEYIDDEDPFSEDGTNYVFTTDGEEYPIKEDSEADQGPAINLKAGHSYRCQREGLWRLFSDPPLTDCIEEETAVSGP